MLSLYNTLTRQKEVFTPIEPGKVRMYVCGMTVYDYCHLGHARVMVVFDMVSRWLRASGRAVGEIDVCAVGDPSRTLNRRHASDTISGVNTQGLFRS